MRDRRAAPLMAALACAGVFAAGFLSLQPASAHRIAALRGRSAHVPTSRTPRARTPKRPNIVFVLTDDLSSDLLAYMPHVQAMQRQGLTFDDYFVSDSLCCPSRSSIFTGNFPHDTGIFGNFGRRGGFHAFHARGEERHTFAVRLQGAGYRTAMMGKYLNGYMGATGRHHDGSPGDVPRTYVPPGWNEWDVAGWGYPEFRYILNENGRLHRFGGRRSDYLTDVLSRRAVGFIDQAARKQGPFFLELATFAPHSPYVPAPRNAHDFPSLQAPQPPSFNVRPTHAPRWLRSHPPLRPRQIAKINKVFRLRARSVEAVDYMISQVESALRANGLARDTYIVFSSDNGLHTGEYRLMPGKLTAFDTDIRVPLVVTGPGVPRGMITDSMAENVDLAKTFTAIGGTTLAGDGRSLLPLLRGNTPRDWRNAVLIEHRSSLLSILDPDFQQRASGTPTAYEAMRTRDFLYVEYADREHEYYDLRTDPFELHNIFDTLTPPLRALLHAELRALKRCHGGNACWAAMHVATGTGTKPPRAKRAAQRP